ncbi:MAG: adenylate/guanylate cyclase domain-containing protein [Candidatus Margulisiibacteriota bacterium]
MNWKRIIAFTLLLFFIISSCQFLGLFDQWELRFYNWHFLARGTVAANKEIVIVAIDDESIGWMGSWPWSRTTHAQLIKVLEKGGASLIGFDILFDSPSSIKDKGDILLSKSIREAKIPVILTSIQVVNEEGVCMDRPPLPQFIKNDCVGFADPFVDEDGFVRSLYPLKLFQDQKMTSFTISILKALEKTNTVTYQNNKIKVGRYNIPLDDGRFLINFAGPAHWIKTVPYDRVVDSSIFDHEPDVFKDKIVLVGASAIILQDVFYTPFFNFQGQKKRMPGVEIRANELATILDGRYINRFPSGISYLVIFLLILISVTVFFKVRAILGLVIALGEMAGFLIISSLYFNNYSLWLGISVPVLSCIPACYLTVTIDHYIQEEREKRRIRNVFSRYVAPSVVNKLLEVKDSLNLAGEKKEITVFFSDIRSFTTFSESRTPEEVVSMLNEYLDAMTKVIFDFGGTLDKYVGDEIMAVWGAPLEQPNHAELAVKCSIEQIKVLREMQKKWVAEGKHPLDIGIGLNTGPMVVGNIGSSVHMDYTVIGDAVNLGARLEAETRNHGTDDNPCHIIISESTYDLVKDVVQTKPLGDVKVKGKNLAVKIYEVMID